MPQEYAQALKTITIPAPTRGIVWSENDAFMAPGAAIIQDNWIPTMKGDRLRGGTQRYCDLHALDQPAWANSTAYSIGNQRYDGSSGTIWQCAVAHTSPATPTTFAQDRAANPTRWTAVSFTRNPVISAFEYISGNTQKMFAGQDTKLFDVTANTPILVKSGQTSGNYVASQLANLSGYWMLVCNETGDSVLRFDGTTWTTLTTELTGGPVPGTSKNLSYVCKYRNRYFFIETKSMNLWFLPIDSHQGPLTKIPMSGAAQKGGYLVFLADWSIDAGDGIDNKLIAATSMGEILVFTGSDPTSSANWRQEGLYQMAPPLGMNAHMALGGDVLVATMDGIVPVSACITKDSGQLELAMITRPIKPLWRDDVVAKRDKPWSMERWDEQGIMLVASPGGLPGKTHAWVANNATGAWCTVSYDATCWLRMRADLYFGDQRGWIMQCERTGLDDARTVSGVVQGNPYYATLVGGWEMFQSRSQQVVWHQARAIFSADQGEPFQPQLSATTDFVVVVPQPPPPGPDPGLFEVWDQGLWDQAHWDAPAATQPVNRNTMWVSIGMTGFSHAPIVQVTVAQKRLPGVELLAIAATFEVAGVNV